MALTVVGVFDNASEAQQAVEALVSDGFSRNSIDLSTANTSNSGYSDSNNTYSTGSTGSTIPDRHQNTSGTWAEEVADDTKDAGSRIGDQFPDRHRNTSGTMAEEVVDDTKDVGSGIGSFFSNLFGLNDDADRYTRVGERSSIVTVHVQTNDEAERAADILDDHGAVDVDERDAQYGNMNTASGMTGMGNTMGTTGTTGAYTGSGTTGTFGDTGTTGAFADAGTTGTTGAYDNTFDNTSDRTNAFDTNITGDQTIKVVEENMQVGKREVETGGVRVRSRIVERPVEESLRLREERVVVQRNPVNRPATEADLNAFQEGQIEMRETAERAVVSKTANVVEEISIGKEVNEREEVIRDTVRKTEVDVDNLQPTTDTYRTTDTTTDRNTTYNDPNDTTFNDTNSRNV